MTLLVISDFHKQAFLVALEGLLVRLVRGFLLRSFILDKNVARGGSEHTLQLSYFM